jgi:hypothetical protein
MFSLTSLLFTAGLEKQSEVYAKSELPLASSLFLDVIQRRLLVIDVSGQSNGPVFKGQGVEETSLTNYRSTFRNIPEERSGSLKS